MRQAYRHRIADYAGIYSTSPRTIKGWIRIGKDALDRVPLDSPGEMPAWWQRNMSHGVPAKIFAAAEQATAPARLATMPPVMPQVMAAMMAPAAGDVEAEDLGVPALPPVIDGSGEALSGAGVGLEAELERLEILSRMLGQRAHEPGHTKAYLDSLQRMTALHKQVREEAEKTGRLLPRALVEQAIHDREGPIERELRLLAKTMCEAIGLPLTPKFEEQWHRELDAVFARWQQTIFRE